MAYARATYKIRDGIKFILICGNISVLTLSVLLKEYFHEDHGKEEKHCLILMPQNPDNDMEELLKLYKTSSDGKFQLFYFNLWNCKCDNFIDISQQFTNINSLVRIVHIFIEFSCAK